MSCVVWGIALKTLTLQLLYLDYILPTLGCILLVLGFRTLRQENRALRWAYGPVSYTHLMQCPTGFFHALYRH